MINSTIKIAQQRLLARGFNLGSAGVDGVMGPDTRAALRAFRKSVGLPDGDTVSGETMTALLKPPNATAPPMPRPRPLGDVLNDNPKPRSNVPPTPQLRPTGEVARTNATSPPSMLPQGGPRLGMGSGGLLSPDIGARPDQPRGGLLSLENTQLNEARQNLNPDVQIAPWADFNTKLALAQTGNARTREAQSITGPLKYQQRTGPPPPPQVGTMMNFPFASRWTESPSPPSPTQQVAGSASPTTPPSPPPPSFQPTPGNPGFGFPGLPPRANFGEAVGDVGNAVGGGISNLIQSLMGKSQAASPQGPQAQQPQAPPQGAAGMPAGPDLQGSLDQAAMRKALELKLWEMMLGARIQPQPSQPAYSDQFSTASKPPAFTSPMGPYR